MMKKTAVLFLCTGNSCRSQMAEGWAKSLKRDVMDAYSAGVQPQDLNPNAVRAMAEAGVDITNHRSKHLDELSDIDFAYVVTVCSNAQERCPVFPGTVRVVHRGFDDPPRLAENASSEEEAMQHYRRVRDQIRDYVKTLPEELDEHTRPL
jgi:arsenate reductase